MAYTCLPVELWEVILAFSNLTTTLAVLATSRQVRRELGPSQHTRLEAAKLELGKARVQAWLIQTARDQMTVPTLQPSWRRTATLYPCIHSFTALLGSAFIRMPVHKYYLAPMPLGLGTRWVRLYSFCHGLDQETRKLKVDAALARVFYRAEGSFLDYASLPELIKTNLYTYRLKLIPEDLKRVLFAYHYLRVALHIVETGPPPELQSLDPAGTYFRSLELYNPPLVSNLPDL